MELYAKALNTAILFFMALIAIEYIVSLILEKPVNKGLDTISSLSSGMTNTVKDILGLTIVILSYEWMVKEWSFFEMEATWQMYILGFILIDFAAYWSHRWNHEFNVLWNRHIVHHSSEEFNLSAALRQSISGIIGIYFFLSIPMALIGIPKEVIAILGPLHLFAQFWYHTRLIDKMGFLENIIVTPSHHRVHHAINKEYMDKNYAAIFIFWDKWFGTFQAELKETPPVYGVSRPVNTWNPIIINFLHLWQIIKDAWYAKHWVDKFRIWFMPTGWRPEDVKERFPLFSWKNPYEQQKYSTPANSFLMRWFWFQLVLHVCLEVYLLAQIVEFEFLDTFLYGIFLMISIFAYTSLMDRHPLAVPVEIIKATLGFVLLYKMNGWYLMDNYFQFASVLMGVYLVGSLAVTVYYTYFDKEMKMA